LVKLQLRNPSFSPKLNRSATADKMPLSSLEEEEEKSLPNKKKSLRIIEK